MMQHAQDAEDVAQEVFIAVHEHIRSFRGDAKLSTWIYRIAITKSLDALRKRKRRSTQPLPEDNGYTHSFHHPGTQLANKELAAMLFKAISRLPDNQKTAFILHKTEGQSYSDIAEIMNTSLPAVESLMFRAKQKLQKLLAQYYDAIKN